MILGRIGGVIMAVFITGIYVPWMYFRLQVLLERGDSMDTIWSGMGWLALSWMVSAGAALLGGYYIDKVLNE